MYRSHPNNHLVNESTKHKPDADEHPASGAKSLWHVDGFNAEDVDPELCNTLLQLLQHRRSVKQLQTDLKGLRVRPS